MSKRKSTLVTGAGGFIGSHLVERLVRDGHDVRAFVHYNSAANWHHLERIAADIRSEISIVPGDITDAQSVDRAVDGCSQVFHLAALIAIPYSYTAPASYVATNIGGTLNVLQACLRYAVNRLVHTSTSEVYGTAQYVPIDEKHPLVGQSPYAASKIGADQLVVSFHRSFDLPTSVVRPFNTYGPRQSARAVIPTIVVQALQSERIKLGSLSPVRDLTYVDDTVAGFLAVARSDAVIGQTVNLGVGHGVSIGDLVTRVGRVLGKELVVETQSERLRPERSEVHRLISDNRRVKELTDWEPIIGLDQGLERVIEYVQGALSEYKPNVYNV